MGGPVGLNTTLPSFARLPSPVRSFASGAYGVRGMVWWKVVQEGRIDRARAQRAVEHLVTASRSHVDRFGEFNADEVRASLERSTETEHAVQLSAGGSGSRRVPPGRGEKLKALGGATAGGVTQHPRVAELMRELAGGVRAWQDSLRLKPEPVDLDKLIPPKVVQKLNAIASALDKVTNAHRTGEDIERLLIEEGIVGLAWSHRGGEGIAPIYFSPLFLETPWKKYQVGLMLAVFPKKDPSASAEVMITWQISNVPRETVLPEPPQMVPDAPSERALRIRCLTQLHHLDDYIQEWRIAPPSEELGRKVAEYERGWEGKELRELMEIVDSSYTFVTNATSTLAQLSTREQRDLVQQQINDNLATLVAIANILRDRGF